MAILRYQGVNYGSLILIEYAAYNNIVSFGLSGQGTINSAGIVFYEGYGWTAIYCSEDTMGHHQLQVNDDNGETWQHEVVGFCPGDEADIETGMLNLQKDRYLLRVTRPDGTMKIVGTKAQPLELVLDMDTTTTIPGAAGTAISFKGVTGNRALFYSA